eukprot:TRINITY_DN11087_c0_g1_i1.p1 TRINITY_DN11087_c0_g1~~TRINITY_DN11087_c0_g1_i1.p1  ORF type:complete len:220 (+),score=24.68 TRINITY_DN11087_c0_g1_i1:117-776(+)
MIIRTLGDKLRKQYLVPALGASAVISAVALVDLGDIADVYQDVSAKYETLKSTCDRLPVSDPLHRDFALYLHDLRDYIGHVRDHALSTVLLESSALLSLYGLTRDLIVMGSEKGRAKQGWAGLRLRHVGEIPLADFKTEAFVDEANAVVARRVTRHIRRGIAFALVASTALYFSGHFRPFAPEEPDIPIKLVGKKLAPAPTQRAWYHVLAKWTGISRSP